MEIAVPSSSPTQMPSEVNKKELPSGSSFVPYRVIFDYTRLSFEKRGYFSYNNHYRRYKELVSMAIYDCQIGTVSCKACFGGDTLHGREMSNTNIA